MSTKYVADIGQGGLGMPDRDYYLKADDARMADARAKYQQHVERMLAHGRRQERRRRRQGDRRFRNRARARCSGPRSRTA